MLICSALLHLIRAQLLLFNITSLEGTYRTRNLLFNVVGNNMADNVGSMKLFNPVFANIKKGDNFWPCRNKLEITLSNKRTGVRGTLFGQQIHTDWGKKNYVTWQN